MDYIWLCFGLLVAVGIGLVVLFGYAISRRQPQKLDAPASPRAYLNPDQRFALLNLLSQIRTAPDKDAALDKATHYVATALWLPTSGEIPDVPSETVPPTRVPVPSQAIVPTPTPASLPPPSVVPSTPVARWVAPDNITILLYVGAALFIIAAGVFVGSSWDAISGFARFMIVSGSALAFLLVGEGFVRFTDRLEPAGNTFRSVGTVLLPFTALAFDRFVLSGHGSPLYWVVVGLLLMLINYGLYRLSQKGRLTGYMAAFSYGIFGLSLPTALGWGEAWLPATLWAVAGVLFFIAARIAPDGRALVRQFFRKTNDPLAESHFVLGWLLGITGCLYLLFLNGAASGLAAFSVLTVVMVGVAFYLHLAVLMGIAALSLGGALIQLVDLVGLDNSIYQPLALMLMGVFLVWLAPRLERHAPFANAIVSGVAFGWVLFARSTVNSEGVVQGLTVLGYVGVALFLAVRFRNLGTWAIGMVVLNVAVFDILSLFSSDSPSALIPTVLLLGLAGFWLALEDRPPYPAARGFAIGSFVAQAVWLSVLLFGAITAFFFNTADVPLAAFIGTGGLTAGWTWLATRPVRPW